MKKIVCAGLLCLLIASCTNTTYTIEGQVDDPALEGAMVQRIGRYDVSEMRAASTALDKDSTYVKDGKYSFTGKTDGVDYCTVYVGKDERGFPISYATVVIEPGARLKVVTDAKDVSRVGGSVLNDVYQRYADVNEEIRERFRALFDKREQAAPEELPAIEAQREALYNEMSENDYRFVKDNINNPAAWSMLYNAGVMTINGENPIERLKELIAGADDRTKELGDYKDIVSRIETLERTAVGQKFTDLEMADPEGNPMKLSDYAGKGKYILVDFWASWCGPCKAEMPNIVKLYHQYKDRNFDIVSVSFDTKKENWVKAIPEWGMPWHHMSDLKGWDSAGSSTYSVSGIPHTMLLDPDGKILARGLYGEELYAKLAELLD